MGAATKIQWTDRTFNPWRGCQRVSEGCRNCYAEALSRRNPNVLGVWGPKGTRVLAADRQWLDVLGWEDQAAAGDPQRKVFCASLADVFEAWDGQMTDSQENLLWWHPTDPERQPRVCASRPGSLIPDPHPDFQPYTLQQARERLWRLIERTPHLIWQLVTKRPENMRPPFVPARWAEAWPPNVWAIASVESQDVALARITDLVQVPATVRGLSCEPLLGPVDLYNLKLGCAWRALWCACSAPGCSHPTVNWVIVGGESGPDARPCQPLWVRSLVKQCKSCDVPVFVKQLGSNVRWEPASGPSDPSGPWPEHVRFEYSNVAQVLHRIRFRDAKAGDPSEWAEDLRVREFPSLPSVR